MGNPFSRTQSLRVLTNTRYIIPALLLLITVHYLRSFSLDEGATYSSLSLSYWRSTTASRLKQSLDQASTSDLIEVLEHRLSNSSNPKNAFSIGLPPRRTANATIVMLVRNSEVNDAAQSIIQMEDRFNHKYHYPWVFLNDEPFEESFIQRTSQLVSGNASYGIIKPEHWNQPEWIDEPRAAEGRRRLVAQSIIYGGSISYRNMCRFNSGYFYRHELLQPYRYYWRVEPNIKYFCDVNYDPFVMMEEQKKVYGFTIALHEWGQTIPTLWDEVKEFMKQHPEYIIEGNSLGFLTDDNGESYNLCHFWSNFEIADLDFWRSEAYGAFFEHLEKAGGFYYERWGDAPVHSIAASLFARKDQIHFFNDIGYRHDIFQRCPQGPVHERGRCWCDPSDNFDYNGFSCLSRWENVVAGRI